jgi:hypothetical protein
VEQNELLHYTIQALEELGIAYMIGGSLASSAYGEPRLTNDIDVVADLGLEHLQGLIAKFPQTEFYIEPESIRDAIARKGQFNIIHPSSGYKIDIFICGKDAFGRSQLSRRRRLETKEQWKKQLSPEAYYITRGFATMRIDNLIMPTRRVQC